MNFNNLNQLYRSVIMDHYKSPRNKGTLDNGSMTVDMNNPTCGDRIHLTFDIEDGFIKDAKFDGTPIYIELTEFYFYYHYDGNISKFIDELNSALKEIFNNESIIKNCFRTKGGTKDD